MTPPYRSLRLLVIGTVAVLGLGYLGLKAVTRPMGAAGCPVSTTAGTFDTSSTVAFWNNRSASPLLASLDSLSESDIQVLGATTADKWIEIDLTRQMIYAHRGEQTIMQSPISSGLWRKTPTGEFRIWYKIRYTKMEGGSKTNNTYYYLPNVPYTMFFSGDYGIHGAYWHNNFGQPMSHGCVNAPPSFSEKLFYWADPQLPAGKSYIRASADVPGTRVIIHY